MHHWWIERQGELQALAEARAPVFVYNEEILNEAFFDLLAVPSVEMVFQSAEAAPYAGILQKTLELGAGFQCRTLVEVHRLSRLFPGLDPQRLLFVPPREIREEYEQALESGIRVVSGTDAWRSWPDLFNERPVLRRIRIHSGTSVLEEPIPALSPKAAGIYLELQKTQISSQDLTRLVTALHEQAGFLPDRHVLCLGRGTGLPIHPEKDTIMTSALCDHLEEIMEHHAGLRIWVEPGRHLISHAGILLAKVTAGAQENRTNEAQSSLDTWLGDRCFAEEGPAAVYELNRPDQAPRRLGDLGDESLDAALCPGTLSFSKKRDMMVITNQGWAGSRAEGPLASVEKHLLKARRICRVKL